MHITFLLSGEVSILLAFYFASFLIERIWWKIYLIYRDTVNFQIREQASIKSYDGRSDGTYRLKLISSSVKGYLVDLKSGGLWFKFRAYMCLKFNSFQINGQIITGWLPTSRGSLYSLCLNLQCLFLIIPSLCQQY